MTYDKVIVGAGLYGLYAADFCAKKGEKILVLEWDDAPFSRATYINQARVHMGYHYPRSLSTAMKSAGYFERFYKDFSFCINEEFEQIYAISSQFSWTGGEQFQRFCQASGIPCEEVSSSKYFNSKMCDGAFLTKEYTYDAIRLKDYFLKEISEASNVEIKYHSRIIAITQEGKEYIIRTEDGEYRTGYILNAGYASVNQVLEKANYDKLGIKYELCEIILVNVSDNLSHMGLTVMDGPFFSVMPFGKSGLHSLTSVTFTPHTTCYAEVPSFACQERSGGYCSPKALGNCNQCPARPSTAFPYMNNLVKKYLKDEYELVYNKSLFSMKPILKSSEIDDSRPTVIRKYSSDPTFVSVLSGKINTVYDLDEVL